MEKVVENALEFVKKYFENECSGHDYFHTLRVFKMAKQIALKENANVKIVMLAALLHDVDDINISLETNANKNFLALSLLALVSREILISSTS